MNDTWAKLLLVLACWWLPAQGLGAAPPAFAAPRGELVYVIAGSWHTEIALPKAAIGGLLGRLAADYPTAPYLIFGWGARDFFMAPHPGLADLLRAAAPGPAAMLVISLGAPPTAYLPPNAAWALAVSPAGAARLSQFLWNGLAKDRGGSPIRLGSGPYPQSDFYAASGTYDAAHTCNTWTAEALRAAGVPVSAAGVVFPGQLTAQLPALAAASPQAGR